MHLHLGAGSLGSSSSQALSGDVSQPAIVLTPSGEVARREVHLKFRRLRSSKSEWVTLGHRRVHVDEAPLLLPDDGLQDFTRSGAGLEHLIALGGRVGDESKLADGTAEVLAAVEGQPTRYCELGPHIRRQASPLGAMHSGELEDAIQHGEGGGAQPEVVDQMTHDDGQGIS